MIWGSLPIFAAVHVVFAGAQDTALSHEGILLESQRKPRPTCPIRQVEVIAPETSAVL